MEKDGVWQGVGEESSNGCIRMRDPDVEELFDFAAIAGDLNVTSLIRLSRGTAPDLGTVYREVPL